MKGYSLVKAAAATAYFNTGERPVNELPKDFPFQILYTSGTATANTFNVKPGTAFYVPVVWDASLEDVTNRQAVQDLYFDLLQYGAESLKIGVDSEDTLLGREYAVGVKTPGLRPGIDNYTTVGAFLSPLSPGTHTVTIAGRFTGAESGGGFEFEIKYTVIVG